MSLTVQTQSLLSRSFLGAIKSAAERVAHIPWNNQRDGVLGMSVGDDFTSVTSVSIHDGVGEANENNKSLLDFVTISSPVNLLAMAGAAEERVGQGFNTDGWTSVDEALPPPLEGRNFSDMMIVVDINSHQQHATMARLHYCKGENVWSGCNTTHWMTLPGLPSLPRDC